MSDISHNISTSGEQQKGRSRLPSWAKGLLAGELTWGLALVGVVCFDSIETWLPPLFRQSALAGILPFAIAFVAAPIAAGGWMLVWGDNGPPYAWIESWGFNIGFGVCFYGLLGVLIE